MIFHLGLEFKKRKIYTDGISYYRFIGKSYLYDFELVKFNEKRNRFITTHNEYRFTAKEAARLTEV